jgi:hypothetical protein
MTSNLDYKKYHHLSSHLEYGNTPVHFSKCYTHYLLLQHLSQQIFGGDRRSEANSSARTKLREQK